ncbi:MAG TPA: ATP-dependent DNA helicase [Acidimicrobiales bacterium]|nr:ATP-dependent DNA helicase [Acidimicrobiales bacterium]
MPDPEIDAALAKATGALAHHEDRPSQKQMADAVATAIRERRHLIVQAGTGTGKSLAYLVPVLVLGQRAIVSTATKALQDQLAKRDLPQLALSLDSPVEFAVLKGRSNYICAQRVAEISGGDEQLVMDEAAAAGPAPSPGPLGREVRRLVAWSQKAETGDRADLDWEPSPFAWAQVSVSARDCPGAARCPSGGRCFAESARETAANADVIIVNTHLYATSLAIGGELLPPHDVVVFDEAHELEDIASASFGFEVGAGRLQALARATRPILEDHSTAMAVDEAGLLLADALSEYRGSTLPRPLGDATLERLVVTRERVVRLAAEIRKAVRSASDNDSNVEAGVRARHLRAQQAASHLERDLGEVIDLPDSKVSWVEGPEHAPLLKVAPLDVGAEMTARLWNRDDAPTAVLTSATIPPRLPERLGIPRGSFEQLDVGSPYSYDEQALLYCPLHLPDPRDAGYETAMHDELLALIEAAEGRTLALFTSWRAMNAAAEALKPRIPWSLLTQLDLPKPALVERFTTDEHSCLFATMGFWQGVDVPGSALSLVTIDRLPFPRPDDPLLQARRARLGRSAFGMIDVPRAATLLAQGVGRLIRTRTDRGVVAVFDTRLGKASYRWALVNALPPMRRTRYRKDVVEFLAPLAATPLAATPLAEVSTRDVQAPSAGSASPGRL